MISNIKNLIKKRETEFQKNQLDLIENYDYGLFIRADFFEDKIIKMVKSKTKNYFHIITTDLKEILKFMIKTLL